MADEPRRSGRATKGQTKERDIEDPAPKKKGREKASKAKPVEEDDEDEEDGEEIIRCVCGKYEEETEEPIAMICCDNCSAWQHNECMGLPDDYAPEKYFCEQCKPQNHKNLVAAMKRGEQPWDKAVLRREAAEAERQAKKKGGKKGRKSGAAPTAPTTAKVADSVTTADESVPPVSQEPEQIEQPVSTTPAVGQKRKAEESPAPADVKGNKKARATPVADGDANRPPSLPRKPSQVETPTRQASKSEPSTPAVTDIKDLPASRKGAASSLAKLFVDQTRDAVKAGKYSMPSDTNPHIVGQRLALLVENALYHIKSQGVGEPNDAYKNHLRTMTFNIKKNPALAIRLLNEDLTPHDLASMDPKEMASEEQQRRDAAIMKEMEKQHTIIEEAGPRIRRTHKGDEYIDESKQVAAESLTQNAPVRKPSMIEQDGEVKSPDVKSPTEGVRPRAPSSSTIARPRPSIIDTQRKSSANFDIDKVWSNVQGSPDAEQRFGELPRATSGMSAPEPVAPGARADADIDELLKDEEAESPPYSPKDYANNEGVVWRGVVNGGNLGRFQISAKYAAGATPDAPTLRMTWSQVVPVEIGINGRIQPSKADEYLCGLEYSHTSDLIIIYMAEPEHGQDREQFDKFFRYFKTKERFGVGVQHKNPAIKDIYFIPLEAGQELPTFVKKLETEFPDPTQERMLLVPIVIKNTELPHAAVGQDGAGSIQSPAQGGLAIQTPITPREPGHDSSATNGGPNPYGQLYSQPPVTNGTGRQAPPAPQPVPQYASPPPSYSSQPAPDAATAAAQRVLGPLATKPAVVQLIAQAPNVGDLEMNVVKECIGENPEAANSLEVLTNMLNARWVQGQG